MELLISDADTQTLACMRYGALKHLAVHARAVALDQALANGAHPDSRPDLALRARMLLRHSFRCGLARELRNAIRRAERPLSPWDPSVPLARSAILANREEIAEAARWLHDAEPADVRGIAQIRLLLRDGGSALYGTAATHQLEAVIEQITEALDPFQALAA